MLDFSSLLYEDFMKYQTEFQKFRLARFYVNCCSLRRLQAPLSTGRIKLGIEISKISLSSM